MLKKLIFIAAIITALMVSLTGTTMAVAERPEMVNVLIGFDRQPGPSEEGIVHGAGGSVKYTYHLVPAIAASVPEAAIEGLLKNPRVTRVEPDIEVQAIGQVLPWGINRIDAEVAHVSGSQGAGVNVAILDTGIDLDHPDLNVVGWANFAGGGPDADDKNGHGTHVAGIVAALNNDIGVVGVAPSVSLYAVKVLGNGGQGSYSDVIAGLQWAVDNGMQITNNSCGSVGNPGLTVKQAFDNAYAAGVLQVAAAGNEYGGDVIYPAKYGSVIAVSATNMDDSLAGFSSVGTEVELAAPGSQIYSTYKNGSYAEWGGTSMASPHAAGAAVLVCAANPEWTNDEVRAQLAATADDLGAQGRDALFGYGLVDAEEAALGTETGDDLPAGEVTDIAITAVSAPASAIEGFTLDVAVTVENVGNQDVTGDISVDLQDETDGVSIGTQTILGGLSAGTSTTLSYSWDTTGATLGDHILTATHNFVDDNVANDSESTTVTITSAAEVAVTDISPATVQAGWTGDVTITGSGFVSGADVTFENGIGPAPTASNIQVVDGNTIMATVSTKSGGPPRNRVWDVRATNPDGSSGVLIGGFTVTP